MKPARIKFKSETGINPEPKDPRDYTLLYLDDHEKNTLSLIPTEYFDWLEEKVEKCLKSV